MWHRLARTLSEPRVVTAGAVVAYLIVLVLGVLVLPDLHANYNIVVQVVGAFMIVGAVGAIPAAWIGGTKGRRAELVLMPITAAGLATGVFIEASELWGTDSAAQLIVALGSIVLIVVCLRWIWLRRHYDDES